MRDLQEWTNVDKSSWGPGEWQSEPDKMQWVDEATDLDCLIVRGPSGALCGYVGVAEGHPLFGVDYSDCGDVDLNVHGGLTFADCCHEGQEEGHGICHIPLAGRPDKVWWFGFDCAHAGDLTPASDARLGWRVSYGSYKTKDYVVKEVTELAAQLKAVA